jgi:hypothetical protein
METIKVKIALEINSDGEWQASGSSFNEMGDWQENLVFDELLDGEHVRRMWIEAEIPVPAAEPETVKGEATPA